MEEAANARGVKFQTTPDSYYELLDARVVGMPHGEGRVAHPVGLGAGDSLARGVPALLLRLLGLELPEHVGLARGDPARDGGRRRA